MKRIWAAGALCASIACGGGAPPDLAQAQSTLSRPIICKNRASIGKACDDGNPCTFNDRCAGDGVCVGTPYSCNDGNQCTADACDGKGGCVFTPQTGTACDDGNACTFNDTCANGVCAGTPYSCDDGVSCTTDACDGKGGCTHTIVANGCDDGNPCTADTCDPAGGCVHTPLTDASCDDGNPCTADSCDPVQGCVHTPLTGTSCNDLDLCTFGDVCDAGVCSGTPYSCDDGDPTTLDYCVGDGTCDHSPDPCPGSVDCFANECGSGTICNGLCCVSSCPDGYRDSDESDVDCGGGCPIKCADGKSCWGDWDCQSNHCVYTGGFQGTCVP